LTFPGGAPVTFYIHAVLGGDAAAGGITGAEFRVDNVPTSGEGWFVTPTANAASNVAIGNPIAGGCNIAFPSCQTGSAVLLYTVSGFATTGPSRTFITDRHTTPSNPQFPCPLLVLCDAPVFTKICVGAGEAFLNRGTCTVGVEEKSWSSVKSLFN
jgi:hypothetical protein